MLRELLRAIEEEIVLHKDTICSGLDNFEDYRYHMGVVYGLDKAMETVSDTYRRLINDDEA